MSLWQFYKRVFGVAFGGRFWFAEKISGGFALFLAVVVWYWGIGESTVNWLPFVVFAAIFLPAVVVGLIVAPWKIYKEERDRRAAAEEKLTPKLRLSLPQKDGVDIGFGSTSETMSGRRQTHIRGEENVLRVVCANSGSIRVDECQANLVDIMKVREDGSLLDVGFRESVQLIWNRDPKNPEFTTSIPANTSKAIYVLASRPNCSLVLYRGQEIPLEYHQIVVDPATYRLWIHVSGANDAAVTMAIDAIAIAKPRGAFVDATAVEARLVDPLQPRPLGAV